MDKGGEGREYGPREMAQADSTPARFAILALIILLSPIWTKAFDRPDTNDGGGCVPTLVATKNGCVRPGDAR